MFDFAWSEMALIAAVALIVIGPKDLPKVLRTLGAWTAKARAVAREFQSSVDQMVREAELDEVRREIEKAADIHNIEREVTKAVDPADEIKTGEIKEALTPPVPPTLDAPPAETPPANTTTADKTPTEPEAVPAEAMPEPATAAAAERQDAAGDRPPSAVRPG